MLVLLLVAVVAAVLFALAWWSSGRSRHALRTSADHEIAKGAGTMRGQQQRNADMGNPLL